MLRVFIMTESPPNRILGMRLDEDVLLQIELTEEDHDKMVKALLDSNLSQQEKNNVISQIINNAIQREANMVEKLKL